MFRGLAKRWGRGGASARLSDLRLPDMHLRNIRWESIRRFAQGETLEREPRVSMVLPAVLTVAGAGAAFWWWRWSQSRGDLDPIIAEQVKPDELKPFPEETLATAANIAGDQMLEPAETTNSGRMRA